MYDLQINQEVEDNVVYGKINVHVYIEVDEVFKEMSKKDKKEIINSNIVFLLV